jgi:hypothetical protein
MVTVGSVAQLASQHYCRGVAFDAVIENEGVTVLPDVGIVIDLGRRSKCVVGT